MTDPAQYHAVIAGLRTSMAQVGSMASSVSQENKLLAAENKRLAGLKEQQDEAIKQLQVRHLVLAPGDAASCREIEG